jgi:glycosyltransferase involved in cell wall biosynthesis
MKKEHTHDKKRVILFLNWKDITHPSAGGAELLTDVLAQHLTTTHNVVYFTSSYPGAKRNEEVHGYHIIRQGNLYTAYLYAFLWWCREGRTLHCEHIIDQVHGLPFFSILYPNRPQVTTLVMEVAGNLWDTMHPFFLRSIGKALEHLWLFLYRTHTIMTISESTKRELTERKVAATNISVIPMFSYRILPSIPEKADNPTLLIVGRIAPGKQIEHAIDAFTIAKRSIPRLRLVIIGKTEEAYEAYAEFLLEKIAADTEILFIQNASEQEKQEWMERSHLLLMTSRKEGYGLVILEAGACGTPTIGYNTGGIRDAVIDGVTGLLSHTATPTSLADEIVRVLNSQTLFHSLQTSAFTHARSHTPQETVTAFATSIL